MLMDSDGQFAAYQSEVSRNVRRNFTFNALDGILFTFGFAFVDLASVVPAFIRRLGGSDFLISVIPAAQAIGWMTPQIFVANFVEGLRRKKPYVIAVGAWERLPHLAVIALCFLLGSSHPHVLIAACLAAVFAAALAFGLVGPAWFDLVAKVTPVRRRGRLSALNVGAGTLLGIGAGWIVERLLADPEIPFPQNFGWLFVLAIVLMSLSLLSLSLVREPVYPVQTQRIPFREYLSRLRIIMKTDRNFRNFLVGTFLQRATIVAVAFYTINALEKFDLPDSWVGRFTVSIMAGRFIGTPIFGLLGDRLGHKINLVIGAMGHFSAAVLAIVAPNEWWYLPVFALVSVGFSSNLVSRFNMVVEFCDPERRPTYLALSSSVLGPTGIVALLGGALASIVGYNGLFVIAGLLALSSAMCLVFGVREPRKLAVTNPFGGWETQ
jgi:MFS family permease